MVKVVLDTKHFFYITSQLSNEREDLVQYFKGVKQVNKIIIELDEYIAGEVRDWAGERLQKVGFDKNYNLTKDGEILENLIDLLYF